MRAVVNDEGAKTFSLFERNAHIASSQGSFNFVGLTTTTLSDF